MHTRNTSTTFDFIIEPLAYHQGVVHGSKFYVVCGEDELQLPTNNIYILDLNKNIWEKKMFNVRLIS